MVKSHVFLLDHLIYVNASPFMGTIFQEFFKKYIYFIFVIIVRTNIYVCLEKTIIFIPLLFIVKRDD